VHARREPGACRSLTRLGRHHRLPFASQPCPSSVERSSPPSCSICLTSSQRLCNSCQCPRVLRSEQQQQQQQASHETSSLSSHRPSPSSALRVCCAACPHSPNSGGDDKVLRMHLQGITVTMIKDVMQQASPRATAFFEIEFSTEQYRSVVTAAKRRNQHRRQHRRQHHHPPSKPPLWLISLAPFPLLLTWLLPFTSAPPGIVSLGIFSVSNMAWHKIGQIAINAIPFVYMCLIMSCHLPLPPISCHVRPLHPSSLAHAEPFRLAFPLGLRHVHFCPSDGPSAR
jgi:hypothetical protein